MDVIDIEKIIYLEADKAIERLKKIPYLKNGIFKFYKLENSHIYIQCEYIKNGKLKREQIKCNRI